MSCMVEKIGFVKCGSVEESERDRLDDHIPLVFKSV